MRNALFELSEIKEELIRERYLRPEKAHAAKPANKSSAPMRFVSSDGIPIYVGKNNRQNDALTLQTARSDNLWLHVKNMPGSHVIVDFVGEPPEATLREAAMLAAYYSQAKTSSNVPVDYTLRKNVKKPIRRASWHGDLFHEPHALCHAGTLPRPYASRGFLTIRFLFVKPLAVVPLCEHSVEKRASAVSLCCVMDCHPV